MLRAATASGGKRRACRVGWADEALGRHQVGHGLTDSGRTGVTAARALVRSKTGSYAPQSLEWSGLKVYFILP